MNTCSQEIESISSSNMEQFLADFKRGKFPCLRMGQAFMNHFFPTMSNGYLYFLTDNAVAERYIRENFLVEE